MSVFVKNNQWANSRVPYVIKPDKHESEKWFDQVNQCVGFALLVPKEASDLNYIQLTIGDDSKSEQIGCKGTGMQTIGGTSKKTVIHELFHAIGFKHEQLHRQFPWNDNDPKLLTVNRMYSYEGKCKTSSNKNLYQAIKDVCDRGSKVFFADNNLNSRLEAILDAQTEHWGDCDLDSRMMYGDFPRALNKAGLDQSVGVIRSGMSLKCDVLSNQDVAALQFMYPPPPPPPPQDFVVTFSGQPDDSLRLTFYVRAAANPGRASKYTADANGRAVVHYFNPHDAEIRVEPWPFWSRIRISPMAANALPGGRYIYTVTLA